MLVIIISACWLMTSHILLVTLHAMRRHTWRHKTIATPATWLFWNHHLHRLDIRIRQSHAFNTDNGPINSPRHIMVLAVQQTNCRCICNINIWLWYSTAFGFASSFFVTKMHVYCLTCHFFTYKTNVDIKDARQHPSATPSLRQRFIALHWT